MVFCAVDVDCMYFFEMTKQYQLITKQLNHLIDLTSATR